MLLFSCLCCENPHQEPAKPRTAALRWGHCPVSNPAELVLQHCARTKPRALGVVNPMGLGHLLAVGGTGQKHKSLSMSVWKAGAGPAKGHEHWVGCSVTRVTKLDRPPQMPPCHIVWPRLTVPGYLLLTALACLKLRAGFFLLHNLTLFWPS